jgi:hypothetical protein
MISCYICAQELFYSLKPAATSDQPARRACIIIDVLIYQFLYRFLCWVQISKQIKREA